MQAVSEKIIDVSLENESNSQYIYQKCDLVLFSKIFRWYNGPNICFLSINSTGRFPNKQIVAITSNSQTHKLSY